MGANSSFEDISEFTELTSVKAIHTMDTAALFDTAAECLKYATCVSAENEGPLDPRQALSSSIVLDPLHEEVKKLVSTGEMDSESALALAKKTQAFARKILAVVTEQDSQTTDEISQLDRKDDIQYEQKVQAIEEKRLREIGAEYQATTYFISAKHLAIGAAIGAVIGAIIGFLCGGPPLSAAGTALGLYAGAKTIAWLDRKYGNKSVLFKHIDTIAAKAADTSNYAALDIEKHNACIAKKKY